ncbi:MAG: peptidylprolyl isomerase [Phycisphaeraceae bacterium]|nr:peptidylprolyl isomerase [Phycisphaeraceae bacterium]MCP4067941.1 peptidylprolyl isomerase [Phycisphaeraceae bacterium]MCP4495442.1 peptidylprolyl isomerase [Phycisphaeraceae bacterium]MCP4795982.1 peptidylprolyl isomerase [Phycisphaeraceae bacterium]MCP4938606.1 peptidylprolyl isomerase [Phycisphaeraceae bacterium]
MQLVTSRGPVTVMLFEEQAPNTVANFIELSEQGFYNGTRFHRVEPNFVVQGGDPNSRPGTAGEPGTGGRGAKIPDESGRDDKRLHFAGALAMAKAPNPTVPGSSIPNTSSSQFYVVLEPTESLNREYTVFGRVIDGMEVLQRIRRDDELTAVTTISRPDREYKATTMLPPSVPPAGTKIDLP